MKLQSLKHRVTKVGLDWGLSYKESLGQLRAIAEYSTVSETRRRAHGAAANLVVVESLSRKSSILPLKRAQRRNKEYGTSWHI